MAVTYESIASQTLTSSASSVVFSSIPSTYTDLILICYNASGGTNSTMQFNTDTSGSTLYSSTQLYANGSTAASLRTTNNDQVYSGVLGTSSTIIINILNYANTTTYKTCVNRGGAGGGTYIDANVGTWRSTAAINKITLKQDNGGGTWASGSTFALYGVKAA